MEGILASELRHSIIRPTLEDIMLWSPAAENLLLGTAAQMSEMGQYLHQNDGKGLGLYQITPEMHDDLWQNYLPTQVDLQLRIEDLLPRRCQWHGKQAQLVTNLAYATAIALAVYMSATNEPMPNPGDVKGMARYWHNHFAPHAPVRAIRSFIDNYHCFVLDVKQEEDFACQFPYFPYPAVAANVAMACAG